MRDRAEDRENGLLQVEVLVARVLLWGGLLSIALVVLGLGLYVGHWASHPHVLELHRNVKPPRQAHPPEVFVSLTEIFRGIATRPIDPDAVIALGLVLLLATPLLGVALAIPGFLAAGDRRYTVIAAIILVMLVLGALLTGGVG